jgi:hypothetical protein
MKMCLAPCYKGCSDERYAAEAAAVECFLATRGESKLVVLRAERERASTELEFETAAALHTQVQKVESVRALAPELVRPLSRLRAVILQASANLHEVAVFLFENGRLSGPAAFSTLGMRIQNEQSGSSSLFAHPMAIEPIPETTEISDQRSGMAAERLAENGTRAESALESDLHVPVKISRGMLEARMETVLAELTQPMDPPPAVVRQGHLALLKRWYYRPEARRTGEIFFPDAEGRWPVKAMLRGVGRVAAGSLQHGNPQD